MVPFALYEDSFCPGILKSTKKNRSYKNQIGESRLIL